MVVDGLKLPGDSLARMQDWEGKEGIGREGKTSEIQKPPKAEGTIILAWIEPRVGLWPRLIGAGTSAPGFSRRHRQWGLGKTDVQGCVYSLLADRALEVQGWKKTKSSRDAVVRYVPVRRCR